MTVTKLPDRWWRDKQVLRREVREHGSINGAALAHGATQQTLNAWWHKHGFDPLPTGPIPKLRVVGDDQDDAWLLAALKKLGDQATLEQLADHADVAPKKVRDAAARLRANGYRIELGDESVVLERVVPARDNLHQLSPALFDGETLRVGVVSDTHLGANEEALDELELAYDIFAREGISEVWHAGDVGCGVNVFGTKQHTESKVHTLDQARDYIIANYPRRDGIVTKAIGGNHDLEGLAGRSGLDLTTAVAHKRDDIEYLGPFEAWLELRPDTGRWVHLLHGKGGMSYAYSYKAQKLVDGYPGGRKPSALIVGHWHVRGNIRARDVEVLWPGCFEWQSQFMARLGLHPAVGFHILQMTVADDGSIVRWLPEWFPFYAGRKAA